MGRAGDVGDGDLPVAVRLEMTPSCPTADAGRCGPTVLPAKEVAIGQPRGLFPWARGGVVAAPAGHEGGQALQVGVTGAPVKRAFRKVSVPSWPWRMPRACSPVNRSNHWTFVPAAHQASRSSAPWL